MQGTAVVAERHRWITLPPGGLCITPTLGTMTDRSYVESTPEDAAVARRLRRRRGWKTFGQSILAIVAIVAACWYAISIIDVDATLAPSAPAPAAPADSSAVEGIPSGATKATVNYVHDGDTLFLDTPSDSNLKVRLLGVDTPEVGDNLECYGNEARDYLRSVLREGSTVYVVADVSPLDQYGRSLLFVYTADGVLTNYELVAGGYAESVFIGDNRVFEREFEAAEDEAQAAGAGMWGRC